MLCDETKQWLQSRPSPLTLMKVKYQVMENCFLSLYFNPQERNPVIKRQLQVIFAPHLPSTSCFYYIDAEGVHGYKEEWC